MQHPPFLAIPYLQSMPLLALHFPNSLITLPPLHPDLSSLHPPSPTPLVIVLVTHKLRRICLLESSSSGRECLSVAAESRTRAAVVPPDRSTEPRPQRHLGNTPTIRLKPEPAKGGSLEPLRSIIAASSYRRLTSV